MSSEQYLATYEMMKSRLNIKKTHLIQLVSENMPNRDVALEQIESLYQYYWRSINKSSPGRWESITDEFAQFVMNMEQVKCGVMSSEDALATVSSDKQKRISSVSASNIARIFELFFWTVAAASCFTAMIAVGLPLIGTDALVGIAVTVTSFYGMWQSVQNISNCFNFSATDRHELAGESKTSLVSFFKPPVQDTVVQETFQQEVLNQQNQIQTLYPITIQ